MTMLEPLTYEHLTSFFETDGLDFFSDAEGFRHLVRFSDLDVICSVEADVVLNLVSVFRINGVDPASMTPACNSWNSDRRWPRMFVRDDQLVGDFSVALPVGVTQEQVNEFCRTFIGGCLLFVVAAERSGIDKTFAEIVAAEGDLNST